MAKKRAIIGFGYHLTAFLAINAVLIWINIDRYPEYFWAQWPLIGWGIGLMFHGLSIFLSSKSHKGFFYHIAAYFIINAVLIFINLTLNPQYVWFKFPLIAWSCILIFHAWRIFSNIGHKKNYDWDSV
jgi:uncharacterized membrane protein